MECRNRNEFIGKSGDLLLRRRKWSFRRAIAKKYSDNNIGISKEGFKTTKGMDGSIIGLCLTKW